MPELPEVETIVRQLNKEVKGKAISRVKVIDYAHKVRGDLTQKALAEIKEVKRRAKLLIFNLSNGYSFIIHLKMTGQLLYYPKPPAKIPKATHVIFYFKDGSALLFNDFRKFGFVKITKKIDDYLIKQKFGPEPLKLSLAQFQKLLSTRPRSRIKPIIMDQSFIAGIGNIYAQEACFKAGILPTRQLYTLTKKETEKLYEAIQDILNSAIKHKGTSFDTNYVLTDGERGGFKSFLKVYHQQKCPKSHSLKRINLGSRGTYYCEKCQR